MTMDKTNCEFDAAAFCEEFEREGSVLIESVLDMGFVRQVTQELEVAIEKEVSYHGTTEYPLYGYVLSNAIYGGSFLKIFDYDLVTKPIDSILGGSSIAYSYTSSSMPPGRGNESSHIHVDCPIFLDDYILRMGVIMPLTDFRSTNGATLYLPRSHRSENPPTGDYFYKYCKVLEAPAGSAWFFNTRLWHTGGRNSTDQWRHALTLNMCRPWMKQRVDIPALMDGMDLSDVSAVTKQKLGLNAIVPRSYDEYFIPDRRTFTQSNL